jgi:hypothetical protein
MDFDFCEGCPLSRRGDALSLGFDFSLGEGDRYVVVVVVVVAGGEEPEAALLPEFTEATVDVAVLESADAMRDLLTILGVWL